MNETRRQMLSSMLTEYRDEQFGNWNDNEARLIDAAIAQINGWEIHKHHVHAVARVGGFIVDPMPLSEVSEMAAAYQQARP